MHLLIVEDDPVLARGLDAAVRRWGHTAEAVGDAPSAIAALRTFPFDLVLLDLGLARGDGLDVLAALRRDGRAVPTIVLTARDTLPDRVRGLDAGADDYLVKPFELDELAARIRAVQRRATRVDPHGIRVGPLVVDGLAQQASWDGRALVLTRQEFQLLQALAERAGRVVTREVLERVLYGDAGIESNALEVHVHALRRKTTPPLIRTVRGVGYLMENE